MLVTRENPYPFTIDQVPQTPNHSDDIHQPTQAMWRSAVPADDEAIVGMCIALNTEDPGPHPVPAANTRRTLHELREAPVRGRAMVLELDSRVRGYALLVSFWSNEIGGEVCTIDELYVMPEHRGSGHATRLFQSLSARSEPWLESIVALALEVTPSNVRARRFYERLGFRGSNVDLQLRFSDPQR